MREDEKMRMLRNQQIGQEGGEFGAFAPLYQAGRRFGEVGSQAIVKGLFPEAEDPSIRQAQVVQLVQQKYQGQNLGDPSVLKSIASDLFTAGAPDAGLRILKTAEELTPKDKLITGKAGDIIYRQTPTGSLEQVAAVPDRESIVKTPADFAAAGRELGFGVRPNIGDYSQQETAAVNNLLETRGIRRAEAGVPKSGEVKVTDIKGAQDIVATYTKAPQDRLSTVRQLRVSLGEAKQGTGSALPQLRRDLVKLVGDNQIGQAEAQQALGSIGIVGDAISGINQLFTGVPSAEKLKDVEKFITALETEHAKSYNRGRETANKVLSEAKLSPETVKTLIPPEYKTRKEKSTGFVEGKVYRDASGNRARYVNGKWEPVQ
jgi:hypothetical protein